MKYDYDKNYIFHYNEARIFHQLIPDKTLRLEGEKYIGGKLSKETITVFVGANTSRTVKQKLLVTGKPKNSRCFKNVKNLSVRYKANKNELITSELFTEELMT